MKDKVDVKLDSLASFGQGLFNEVNGWFQGSSMGPLRLLATDQGKGLGSRAIGNHYAMEETNQVADYLSGEGGAVDLVQRLTSDLTFGGIALANAAMWISENYGGTDGWNAVHMADAVNDAFHPPSDAKGGTLADSWGKRNDELDESIKNAHLPHVTRSESYDYVRHGLKEGEDYILVDEPSQLPSTGDPLQDGDYSNGEDTTPRDDDGKATTGEGNEYYQIPEEDDVTGGGYQPDTPTPAMTDPPDEIRAPGRTEPGVDDGGSTTAYA
ncbi:MAG: hypothetical protein ACRDT6_22560 [Micromonosporaceae bacterium]